MKYQHKNIVRTTVPELEQQPENHRYVKLNWFGRYTLFIYRQLRQVEPMVLSIKDRLSVPDGYDFYQLKQFTFKDLIPWIYYLDTRPKAFKHIPDQEACHFVRHKRITIKWFGKGIIFLFRRK